MMMKMSMKVLAGLAFVLSASVSAEIKSCDTLKAEIDAKLQAKGVTNYVLEVVDTSAIKDEKVIGSCDGGTKKITYRKS
jgi:hypothetical protein